MWVFPLFTVELANLPNVISAAAARLSAQPLRPGRCHQRFDMIGPLLDGIAPLFEVFAVIVSRAASTAADVIKQQVANVIRDAQFAGLGFGNVPTAMKDEILYSARFTDHFDQLLPGIEGLSVAFARKHKAALLPRMQDPLHQIG
jgi:hypothetical protein